MNHYETRDTLELDIDGEYYSRHVSAMTAEGLNSKASIAAELAFRYRRIKELLDIVQMHDYPATLALFKARILREGCKTLNATLATLDFEPQYIAGMQGAILILGTRVEELERIEHVGQ